jgi:hypothetical protein
MSLHPAIQEEVTRISAGSLAAGADDRESA